MLIPDTRNFGDRYCDQWQVIVKDERNRVIWECPISRSKETDAFADATDAIDLICYERRHQLPLALEA